MQPLLQQHKGETEEEAGDPYGHLQAGDTTAAESGQLESNIWDNCSEKISRGEEPPAVSHHGDGAEHLDTAAGGVVTHLPLLDVIPAHIV